MTDHRCGNPESFPADPHRNARRCPECRRLWRRMRGAGDYWTGNWFTQTDWWGSRPANKEAT